MKELGGFIGKRNGWVYPQTTINQQRHCKTSAFATRLPVKADAKWQARMDQSRSSNVFPTRAQLASISD